MDKGPRLMAHLFIVFLKFWQPSAEIVTAANYHAWYYHTMPAPRSDLIS